MLFCVRFCFLFFFSPCFVFLMFLYVFWVFFFFLVVDLDVYMYPLLGHCHVYFSTINQLPTQEGEKVRTSTVVRVNN